MKTILILFVGIMIMSALICYAAVVVSSKFDSDESDDKD